MERNLGEKVNIVDIKELNNESIHNIKKLLNYHGVIVIPKQSLTPYELNKLASNLGEAIELQDGTEFGEREDNVRSVIKVTNINPTGEIDKNYKGAIDWHTDGDFFQAPYNRVVNLLYADTVSGALGNTLFIDCQKAYRKLPQEIKNYLINKKVVIKASDLDDFSDECILPPAEHNIIYTHPITHEKTIYISGPADKIKIKDESNQESRKIIDLLYSFITQEDNVYRHIYEKGDLVMWDNLTTLHRSAGNYNNQPRLLYRAQVRGIN